MSRVTLPWERHNYVWLHPSDIARSGVSVEILLEADLICPSLIDRIPISHCKYYSTSTERLGTLSIPPYKELEAYGSRKGYRLCPSR